MISEFMCLGKYYYFSSMKLKQSLKFLVFLAFGVCFSSASAQINAITEKGDTILVYENGTWSKPKKEIEPTTIESNVEVDKKKDEFSGEVSVTTKNWVAFGTNSTYNMLSGYVFQKATVPVFYFIYTGDLGCMSKYRSTMKVKLSSGDIIDFIQITDTECGENELVGFMACTKDDLNNDYKSVIDDNLKLLKAYDWETIRIQGTEYYTDIKPRTTRKIEKPEQFFRQHIIALQRNLLK